MQYILLFFTILLPRFALAEPFQRPIPQAQSATAELWYLIATLTFIAALIGVHLLVRRR